MHARGQQPQKRKRVIRSDEGEDSDLREISPPREDASPLRKKTPTRMKTTPVDGRGDRATGEPGPSNRRASAQEKGKQKVGAGPEDGGWGAKPGGRTRPERGAHPCSRAKPGGTTGRTDPRESGRHARANPDSIGDGGGAVHSTLQRSEGNWERPPEHGREGVPGNGQANPAGGNPGSQGGQRSDPALAGTEEGAEAGEADYPDQGTTGPDLLRDGIPVVPTGWGSTDQGAAVR